jgi:hypothetical protein
MVWSVIDYLVYYGAYDRYMTHEIDGYTNFLRKETSQIEDDQELKLILNRFTLPIYMDLEVKDHNGALIFNKENKERWQYICCEDYYQKTIKNYTFDGYTYTYSYYIIPKYYISFLRTISYSLLPDYFTDKTFSFEKWRLSLISYEWQKSVLFYLFFLVSFLIFFVWSVRRVSPEEELESYENLLTEEAKKLDTNTEIFERHKENLRRTNEQLEIKRRKLIENKPDVDRTDIEKLNQEILLLNMERMRIEHDLLSVNEEMASETDNISEAEKNKRIIEIKIEFIKIFGISMPMNLIEQMAEGMLLYEKNPEYISQIMHAWFNGFDYMIKKRAEPFRNKSKKYLMLGDAIKILRAKFSPKELNYYELKTIVNMRNRFSHFETDILSNDNLRMLKTKLFGYKFTDGIFYKLAKLEITK